MIEGCKIVGGVCVRQYRDGRSRRVARHGVDVIIMVLAHLNTQQASVANAMHLPGKSQGFGKAMV